MTLPQTERAIVFPPQPDSFSLAEAAAGVTFEYVVIVTADVTGVTPESQVTCGMPGPSGPTPGFRQILEEVWWKLDRALDAQSLTASAQIGALEALEADPEAGGAYR